MPLDVAGKLDEIYNDLTLNVTRNIGEAHRMLMWAFDACWFSPISFRFQGVRVKKGVAELLIIGDTRTGKSTTIERMLAHYRQGDFIQGDAISQAGLIAGVDEVGGQRFIKAGRLPLSHRRGFIIDEANSMSTEIISKLSGVRSSGIIDIVKIVGGRIPCLTRMVWIANCRGDKKLSEYGYGVEAIPDLIGKPEDIARFDLFVGISHKDIEAKYLSMHSKDFPTVKHEATTNQCHQLVSWAWSRSWDQWIIPERTEEVILEKVRLLSQKYNDSIPICIATELRIQVARLSCAMAARCGSTTDETMEEVLVLPEHVEETVERFMECLDSKSLAYDEWSNRRSQKAFGNKEIERVLQAIGVAGMRALLDLNNIGTRAMSTVMGSNDDGKEVYRAMFLNGALTQTKTGYQLSEGMVALVKKSIASGNYRADPSSDALNHRRTEVDRDGNEW